MTAIKIITTVTFVAMIIVNVLANSIPINGITTGEVAALYPNLFSPASYTFSIWGLIYVLLALFTLYYIGFFRAGKEFENPEQAQRVGILFSISSIANILWIFAWHYEEIWLSLIMMVVMLICLIFINLSINSMEIEGREKFFVKLPFSIYFGWITVATIANVATFLVSIDWDGFGISDPVWTAIIVTIGAIIGLITMITQRDKAYGLVFIWAYVGILVEHVSNSGYAGRYPAVITTVIACLVLFVVAEIYLLATKKQKEIKAK